MKDSHHCCSGWLKIMAISTLCKVYLAVGLFIICVLFKFALYIYFPFLFFLRFLLVADLGFQLHPTRVFLGLKDFVVFVLFFYCLIVHCSILLYYTNNALSEPSVDLLCEHSSDEWCTQMLTVTVSL